jgi:hypothetical protein
MKQQNDVVQQRIAVIDALLSHTKTNITLNEIEGASARRDAPFGEVECALIVSKLIKKSQTFLHLASLHNDYLSVPLLSSTANLSFTDQDGLNELHHSARSGNLEAVTERFAVELRRGTDK